METLNDPGIYSTFRNNMGAFGSKHVERKNKSRQRERVAKKRSLSLPKLRKSKKNNAPSREQIEFEKLNRIKFPVNTSHELVISKYNEAVEDVTQRAGEEDVEVNRRNEAACESVCSGEFEGVSVGKGLVDEQGDVAPHHNVLEEDLRVAPIDPETLIILPVTSKTSDYHTQLKGVERKFEEVKVLVDGFVGGASDKLYVYLDGMLTSFLLCLDDMDVDRTHELYELRKRLYLGVNKCSESLEERVKDGPKTPNNTPVEAPFLSPRHGFRRRGDETRGNEATSSYENEFSGLHESFAEETRSTNTVRTLLTDRMESEKEQISSNSEQVFREPRTSTTPYNIPFDGTEEVLATVTPFNTPVDNFLTDNNKKIGIFTNTTPCNSPVDDHPVENVRDLMVATAEKMEELSVMRCKS